MKQSEKVELIKSSVTLRDVLNAYGYDGDNRRGRIACPLHAGNNKDAFSFNDDVFQCWNCGASGDLISFVMQHDNIDFKTALARLNELFCLWKDKERLSAIKKDNIKNSIQDRLSGNNYRINKKYAMINDLLSRVDANLILYVPKYPDDEWQDEFVEACHDISYMRYIAESEEWRDI